MSTSETPRVRSDARRNRRRILAAARPVLTQSGFSLQMEQIAARADVSSATLYRHFPTKEHLVGEIVAERLQEYASEVEVAWRQVGSGRDPYEALVDGIQRCAEMAAGDRGLQDAIVLGSEANYAQAHEALENLHRATERLISAGIDAGELHPDITPTDITLLMAGLAATQSPRCLFTEPGDWRRHLELALRAIRANPAL